MATLQPNHTISLVYYAGAKDEDPQATVRRSRSTDNGKTFGPSEVLYAPMTLATSRKGLKALGDLLGVASDVGNTFSAFVDNQNESRIRFSRLSP